MDAQLLTRLNEAKAARQAVAVVSDLASGDQRLVLADHAADDPFGAEITARFRSGKSGIVKPSRENESGSQSEEHFIQVYVPPARFVIVGAVHISQALAPMARACDFDVLIIDPRTAFATPERFLGSNLIADWPETVLPDHPLDAYTAMVAVTHDPKIDDPALEAALAADCFYVGALGSRKTHGKRLDRLTQKGVSMEALDRIAAPIGLDIGAATPAEIAVAILAEVIEGRRKPKTNGESVAPRAAA
ncbi:MAG: XdhC family protein [Pseudomonadota bacterium]